MNSALQLLPPLHKECTLQSHRSLLPLSSEWFVLVLVSVVREHQSHRWLNHYLHLEYFVLICHLHAIKAMISLQVKCVGLILVTKVLHQTCSNHRRKSKLKVITGQYPEAGNHLSLTSIKHFRLVFAREHFPRSYVQHQFPKITALKPHCNIMSLA